MIEKFEIIKATKKDLDIYLKLRKQYKKEYFKIVGQKIKKSENTNELLTKEFNDYLSPKSYLVFIKINKDYIGFLGGIFTIKPYYKIAYIFDIFIIKEYRCKGFGNILIKEFLKVAKKKGIKDCKLGVNIKNKNAFNFYKNLGFKALRYEMVRKI